MSQSGTPFVPPLNPQIQNLRLTKIWGQFDPKTCTLNSGDGWPVVTRAEWAYVGPYLLSLAGEADLFTEIQPLQGSLGQIDPRFSFEG